MPAETPPPRPDADPPQCALPEARPDRDAGTKLRAAVLGANDGLVSNLCLVMGVAGASMAHSSIVLTGMAGLVSGACSMALGEWLSVTNAREMASKRIAEEERLLRLCPDTETQELIDIFTAKGLSEVSARRVALQLMNDGRGALDTLSREALGIDPTELGGNPWNAAGTSFLLFSLALWCRWRRSCSLTVPRRWSQACCSACLRCCSAARSPPVSPGGRWRSRRCARCWSVPLPRPSPMGWVPRSAWAWAESPSPAGTPFYTATPGRRGRDQKPTREWP